MVCSPRSIRVFVVGLSVICVLAIGARPVLAQFSWQLSPEQAIDTWVRELVAKAREAARFGVRDPDGEHRRSMALQPDDEDSDAPDRSVIRLAQQARAPKVSNVELIPENGSRFSGIGGPGDVVALTSEGQVLAVTRVAASGRWVLVVDSQLPPGEHLIWAAVRGGDDNAVVKGNDVRIRIPSGYFQKKSPRDKQLAARQRDAAKAAFDGAVHSKPPLPSRRPFGAQQGGDGLELAQSSKEDEAANMRTNTSTPTDDPGIEQWLEPAQDWLELSAETYGSEIIGKLKQPVRGGSTATSSSDAKSREASRRRGPSAPPGPGRSFEFMSFVDAAQDWLARAQRDYQNEVAEKLMQPSDGVVVRQDDSERSQTSEARQAEALRRAEEDRRRALAKREREAQDQTKQGSDDSARRTAEERARKLSAAERQVAEDKRKREAAAQKAEAEAEAKARERKQAEAAKLAKEREDAAKAAKDREEAERRRVEAAKRQAEEKAKRIAAAEAKRVAEENARRRDEAQRKAAEEARAAKEEEAKRVAEERAKAEADRAAAERAVRERRERELRDVAREAELAKAAAARAAVAALKAEESARAAEAQRKRDLEALRAAERAFAKARRERTTAAARAEAERKAREDDRRAREKLLLAEAARKVAAEREQAKARATREAEAAVAAMRRADAARKAAEVARTEAEKNRALERAESNKAQAMAAAKRAQAEERAGEARARQVERETLAKGPKVIAKLRRSATDREERIARLRRNPPPLPKRAQTRPETTAKRLAATPPLPRKMAERRDTPSVAKEPASQMAAKSKARARKVPQPPRSPYRATPKIPGKSAYRLGARRAVYRPKRKRRVANWRASNRTCPDAGRSTSVPGSYTVRRGDTLWAIARRHYGHGSRYPVIYRANRGKIRNPHWIYPCQTFWLPKLKSR